MFRYVFSALVLGCLLCSAAFGQDGQGITIKEVTGDCVIVSDDGQSFTLAGVEFPEIPVRERLARKGRGIVVEESVNLVRSALLGKTVQIVSVAGHGQGAVKLYLKPSGVFFNIQVIEQGGATADSGTQLGASAEFKAAQEKAMLAGAGFWAQKEKNATSAHMGVAAIDNQARTADFVSRYQGPAEESE